MLTVPHYDWLGLDPTQQEAYLRALIDDTTTTAEMLGMFPSAKVPLEYLIDFVPVIKPRLYSIASASEMHPNHIHTLLLQSQGQRENHTHL